MASKQAASRLRKELKAISADPPPHIHVSCDESNILSWNYLLEGPSDTPYEGGWYWGRLKFPKHYPFAPPSILMVTPSGRFETNVRLCLSMSDYHPETWQPAWSLSTVLKGLLSFMCEESPTAGAVDPPPPPEKRRELAMRSLAWNKAQAEFLKFFPEVDQIVAEAEARQPQQAPAVGSTAGTADGRPEAGARDGGDVVPPAQGRDEAQRAFNVGDVIRIHGLKARTDLNGQEGVIEALPGEASADRIQVRVGADSVALKPESMERLRGPSHGP
mmetsp:Transcript_45316/g.117307  ORF Transcript_45316/g.117307 Transcript_45316/m.117307 type:complete len:274 (-) Transcript_45316:19-840(-)|eukprot:CAMPEP_0195136618 /NCGR_PEP_ID=MMETSP0448-20130528/154549_1 /TAXON_ID=66468 /ORGANISM="Heterocapsa triquestra, Strain CCMP 448" /LENGTH=273 /DNA_ID=CAMNT_0040174815 /DNA_START=67 /DNA_END=888 /DNA_ORIENTATION=-